MRKVKVIELKIINNRGLLNFQPWAGAIETYRRVCNDGRIEQLDDVLDEIYPCGLSETEVNDILWFDADWVYEILGMPKDDEDDVDSDEDEDDEDDEN